MSGLLAGRVWISGLDRTLKPLAACLADKADDDGSHIFPTNEYVAWCLGASLRSVIRQKQQLVALGLLEVVEPGHQHWTPEYRMHPDKLPDRPPFDGSMVGSARTRAARTRGDTVSGLRRSRGDSASGLEKSSRGDTVSGLEPLRGDDVSGLEPSRGDSASGLEKSRGDKWSTPGVTNGARTEALSLKIRQRTRQRESDASASPAPAPTDRVDALVAIWNRLRVPGPTLHADNLSPERRRRFGKALDAKPNLDDWRLVIGWLNGQRWANAPGRGDHPRYRAPLDLLARAGKLAELLDQARADGAPLDDAGPTTPEAATWAPIAQALQASGALTKRAWFEWFGEARPVSLRPDAVVVTVPAEHYVTWIAKHYAAALRDAAATAIRPGYAVVIVTADQADQIRRSA